MHLRGFLFPGDTYTLNLQLLGIEDPKVLVYNYDYLDDNETGFTLNGVDYAGDLGAGFEIYQLTSNGISALQVAAFPESYITQNITLSQSYSGDEYVSFAFLIYSNNSGNITVNISTSGDSNETTLSISQGTNTLRGQVKLHFSGENKIILCLTSHVPFYIITDGYSDEPITGSFQLASIFPNVLYIYMKLYGDIVVNSEEYYTPGAVILPGSWQESLALAIKYAPPAYLPVILTQAEYYTAIYTILKIEATASYLFYRAMDYIGGIIEKLINNVLSLFKWVYDTVVHWVISNVSWWLWALLKGIWFIFEITIFILAVWVITSFWYGILALPTKGVRGMLEEWSGVTNFVESIASRLRRWRI